MNTVIKVDNLSKKYTLSHQSHERYVALRDVIANKFKAIGSKFKPSSFQLPPSSSDEEFFALKDVSFEIKQGDRVGIIGRNGAGKSTLLKILSRITEPTSGRIEITGRVASLLEVGTGFHPELTGRENIFLNGAILGMGKAEIKKKFDEIVDFAEVEKFLDTPVKRYSSGMYVRLAFAVAAHLEPEILIVDEVLAVGDAQFQKKCLGKMDEVSVKEGRTVLFVSHNMAAINKLCDTCMHLDTGSIALIGPTSHVIQNYLSIIDKRETTGSINGLLASDTDLDVKVFFACDEKGSRKVNFTTTETINFNILYALKRNLPGLRVGLDLYSFADGEILFRTFDDDIYHQNREQGLKKTMCSIPANLLKPGIYSAKLQIGVHNVRWIVNDSITEKITIDAIDGVNSVYADSRPGKIMPKIDWCY